MSSRALRQGAELRPSLPTRRQTTLLGGQHLKPDGYLFKKQLPDNLEQAHLLGASVKARREGALRDYVAPDKYLQLCATKDIKIQKKCLSTDPIDLNGAGHELTVHDQWPRLEPTGHVRILHANVHGLNYANNNMECDYFIQQMAQHQVDIPMIVEVNQPLANSMVRAN